MHIFVGRDTADMLYEAAREKNLPTSCVKLADRSPAAINRAVTRLNSLIESQQRVSSDILITYSLFDDEIYVDAEGRLPTWHSDNTHHIRGRVETVSKREMGGIITKYRPLFECGGSSAKAVLAPLPLFIHVPCCDDETHTPNATTRQYGMELRDAISAHTRLLRDTLNNNGIRRMRVLNAASTVASLSKEVAWTSNPWKMRPAAYKAVLESVLAEAPSIIAKRPGTSISRPQSRIRSDRTSPGRPGRDHSPREAGDGGSGRNSRSSSSSSRAEHRSRHTGYM